MRTRSRRTGRLNGLHRHTRSDLHCVRHLRSKDRDRGPVGPVGPVGPYIAMTAPQNEGKICPFWRKDLKIQSCDEALQSWTRNSSMMHKSASVASPWSHSRHCWHQTRTARRHWQSLALEFKRHWKTSQETYAIWILASDNVLEQHEGSRPFTLLSSSFHNLYHGGYILVDMTAKDRVGHWRR